MLPGAASVAQELFPATEPASNMPRHSIGIRVTDEFAGNAGNRVIPELMIGATKNLMMHFSISSSSFYDRPARLEGYSVYGKYRFVSHDSVQRHFRGALYGRYANYANPLQYSEVSLEGDNSGWQGGLVFTQLLHKLALSASAGYTHAIANRMSPPLPPGFGEQFDYSVSAGYLAFPKNYTSYKQTNVNFYLEMLGKTDLVRGRYLVDAAPAIQFIFGSRLRADLSGRFQVSGTMNRMTRSRALVRLEYSFFNVF